MLKQHIISYHIFSPKYPKRYRKLKAPAVDLLRLNTLSGTKTAFLTPKTYEEHPRPFYIGFPPPDPRHSDDVALMTCVKRL